MLSRFSSFCKLVAAISFCALLLSGCYQDSQDASLSTVPVTNNPRIVPSAGNSQFSAMGF